MNQILKHLKHVKQFTYARHYYTNAEKNQTSTKSLFNDLEHNTVSKKQYLELKHEINNLSMIVSLYSFTTLTIGTIILFKI